MTHNCKNNVALLKNGEYVEGCEQCIDSKTNTSIYARKFERDRMKENHRATLAQRYDGDKPNSDFVKLYPDKARNVFTEEQMRRYS